MKPSYEQIHTGRDASFRCFRNTGSSFGFFWHLHPEIELTLIGRSAGRRFVGDSIARFHPGDLVLLGPHLPHTWMSTPGRPAPGLRSSPTTVVVQFLPDFLGPEFLTRPELWRVRRLLAAAARGLHFGRATRTAVQPGLLRLAKLTGLPQLMELLAILDSLSRAPATPLASARFHIAPGTDGFNGEHATGAGHRITNVCRFINAHYPEPLSQSAAARFAHLSNSAFSRFFKRATGQSFTDYVGALRLSLACDRLIQTEAKIATIAQDCGFANLSNFNRRFAASKKLTPREFRRQYGGNPP